MQTQPYNLNDLPFDEVDLETFDFDSFLHVGEDAGGFSSLGNNFSFADAIDVDRSTNDLPAFETRGPPLEDSNHKQDGIGDDWTSMSKKEKEMAKKARKPSVVYNEPSTPIATPTETKEIPFENPSATTAQVQGEIKDISRVKQTKDQPQPTGAQSLDWESNRELMKEPSTSECYTLLEDGSIVSDEVDVPAQAYETAGEALAAHSTDRGLTLSENTEATKDPGHSRRLARGMFKEVVLAKVRKMKEEEAEKQFKETATGKASKKN